MTKRHISIVAAGVIAGAMALSFTGCGSSSVSGAIADTKIFDDSLVVRIPTGKLHLQNSGNTAECYNAVPLDIANGKFTINSSDFTCQTGVTTANYATAVLDSGSLLDADGDGKYTAAGDGTDATPVQISDITLKTAKANSVSSILTTLYAEAPSGTAGDAIRASLAGVGSITPSAVVASAPQYYALSQQVKKAKNLGATVSDLAANLTISNLSNASTFTVTANASGTVSSAMTSLVNTDTVKAIGTIAKTVANSGLTTAQAAKILLEQIEKSTTLDIAAMMTSISTAVTTADSTKIVTLNNEVLNSAGVTIGNMLSGDNLSTLNTAATAPRLTVNKIGLKVGAYSYGGETNNFTVSRSNDQTVALTDDVVISVAANGANSFGVTNGTLKVKITKANSKSITMTLNGVTISTASNGAVSASIASGSTISVVSSGTTGIDDVTGTLNKTVTTSDLSFSLNTLIAAISSNTTAINTAKSQLISALTSTGDYTVTVGLNGTMTTGAITNLADVSSALGTGYKGFTGTVTIAASAAATAGIAKASADLATAQTKSSEAMTAVYSISSAATSTAVDTAVATATAAATAATTACDAVLANTYATTTQKETAASIKSTVAQQSTSATALATDRKAYITANADKVAAIAAYNSLANYATNGLGAVPTVTSGNYTLKAKTAATDPSNHQTQAVVLAVKLNGVDVDVPVNNTYPAGTSFTVGVYLTSTDELVGVSSPHSMTSTEITAKLTSEIAITVQ